MIRLRADLPVVGKRDHRHVLARLGGQERLEPGVAGGLVVQPGRAQQVVVGSDQPRRGQVMGHQVGAEDGGFVHARVFGDVAEKRPGAAADAPDRVDVPLRIQRHRLAVLGQVDRQLRHAQDRFVDADQPMVDGVADPNRQPATDAEVAVQPRVQPRPAVGRQRDHLPAGDKPVGVLLDPQVRTVGVGADDSEGPGPVGFVDPPCHERAGPHGEEPALSRPLVAFGEFGEPRGAQSLRDSHADMERRR